MGADAPPAGDDANKKPEDAKKKEGSAFSKKLVKIATVMAYMSGVSGAGFLLSLYYIIFWDPQIQGVRPPGYLKTGEMVGLPQARVAPMPQALVAEAPAGYHKKMSLEYMERYFNNLTSNKADEMQIASDGRMTDSQVTPKALPLNPVVNYNYQNSHQNHHSGQTAQYNSNNNNHQSTGPSPQQDLPQDTYATPGNTYVSDDIRQQQQHGQPPLTSSA